VLTETIPDSSVTSSTRLPRPHHLVTNALSQTSTTLKNSQGQTVSVTDTQSHSTTYSTIPSAT
jgi:YD repeat-containing protein